MSIKVSSHGGDLEIDEEEIDSLRQIFPADMFERLLTNKHFIAHITAPEMPLYPDVLATTLVDVISVTIHNKQRIVNEIYGSIQVIDGDGSTFNLYDRKEYDPETIAIVGSTLTLTFPKGCAIIPSNVPKFEIDLKDHNGEIVKGSFCWGYTCHDDYDTVKTNVIDGVRASATVQYITYRHAVIADVDFILVEGEDDDDEDFILVEGEDDDDECTTARVHGTIVARCGYKNQSLLFNKKQNESVQVEYGSPIEISTHVMVVPALSFLKIDANLWNNEKPIAVGVIQIPAHGSNHLTEYYHLDTQGLVHMRVRWSHAYMQMQSPLEESLGESRGKNIDHMFSVPKRPRLIPDEQPMPALSSKRSFLSDLRISFKHLGVLLMEVFSVSVHSDKDDNFNLRGSITYQYDSKRYVLFQRDKISPERLLPNQTVPIESSIKLFTLHAFRMVLNLKDGNGHQISDGSMRWKESKFDRQNRSCYDLPLCSVIRGDDGYCAAVHYSIFSAGVQATLKIYLLNNKSSSLEAEVDGSVFIEYSNWNYLTFYDKEYYRKKICVKHMGDQSLLHNTDSRVLLSDSVFAVPGDSDLIVDVSLEVSSLVSEALGEVQIVEKRKHDETFMGRLKFETDIHGTSQQKIEGTLGRLLVHVEWKEVSI